MELHEVCPHASYSGFCAIRPHLRLKHTSTTLIVADFLSLEDSSSFGMTS